MKSSITRGFEFFAFFRLLHRPHFFVGFRLHFLQGFFVVVGQGVVVVVVVFGLLIFTITGFNLMLGGRYLMIGLQGFGSG